jgi:serine/threonine-protein phosphatase 2A regulatory subunit B
LKKQYPNLHTYHINSISDSPNCENFISSDDLRIYLWNFENVKEAFSIVDLKPPNLEELSEVITSSAYHPTQSNIFLYSTSKGLIKVGDLRLRSISDKSAQSYEEDLSSIKKSFFTEIVASISDANYTADGKYILSRDFLNVRVWDVRKQKKPSKVIPLFDPLK